MFLSRGKARVRLWYRVRGHRDKTQEVTGNMVKATDDYEPRINKSVMHGRDAAGSVQRVETPPWEGDYCEPGGLTLRLGCCNTLQLRTLK